MEVFDLKVIDFDWFIKRYFFYPLYVSFYTRLQPYFITSFKISGIDEALTFNVERSLRSLLRSFAATLSVLPSQSLSLLGQKGNGCSSVVSITSPLISRCIILSFSRPKIYILILLHEELNISACSKKH